MGIPFVSSIDLQNNELQNARLQNLSSAPAPLAGLVYFNSATKLLGVSDGSVWTYLATTGGAMDPEQVQDIVAGMFGNTGVIRSTYDDGAGTIIMTIGPGQIVDSMVSSSAAISADKIAAGSTNSVLTTGEKTKLAGIAAGATANQADAFLLARANHTGTQTADTIVDGTTNKAFTATQAAKLLGIAANATANQTDSYLLARANHTGTQSADTIVDGSTNKVLTAAQSTKLTGIQTGATANQTDAYLLARANHTGTQTVSTISDFTSAVNAIVANTVGAAPAALDTLKELADALGNDANFATTVTNQLALKANISSLAAVATAGTYASLTAKPSYVTTIGDGTATSYVVTHTLGTQNIDLMLRYSASPYTAVMTEWAPTSNTTATVRFATAPTAGQFTAYISAA
jgi:hypothetical protein